MSKLDKEEREQIARWDDDGTGEMALANDGGFVLYADFLAALDESEAREQQTQELLDKFTGIAGELEIRALKAEERAAGLERWQKDHSASYLKLMELDVEHHDRARKAEAQLEEVRIWRDTNLVGIDKTGVEDKQGWWETSTGADFGASVLANLDALLVPLTTDGGGGHPPVKSGTIRVRLKNGGRGRPSLIDDPCADSAGAGAISPKPVI